MFSSMATHFGNHVDVPAMLVDTGVGVSLRSDTMREGRSAPATVLRSDVVDWSVAEY